MPANSDALARGYTWVVVASAGRAEIYCRQTRSGPLEIVQCLTEDRASAKEQDLVTDEPGRSFDSGGRGRHMMEPRHSGKDQLRKAFAQRIARLLEKARQHECYRQLVLVAAPAMLGELRRQLDDTTAARLAATFDKELTERDPDTIVALIDG